MGHVRLLLLLWMPLVVMMRIHGRMMWGCRVVMYLVRVHVTAHVLLLLLLLWM